MKCNSDKMFQQKQRRIIFNFFWHRGSFENALSWHLYWEVKMYLSGGDVKRSKSQFLLNWISNFLKQSSWNINSTSKTRSFQNQTISSLCPQKKNFNVPKKRCRESVLFECPIFVCLSLRLTWAEYRVVATRHQVCFNLSVTFVFLSF